MKRQTRQLLAGLVLCLIIGLPAKSQSKKFVHPGLDQNAADLALMKKRVLAGEQPWKDAFDRLKAFSDTNFIPKPHTHVLRGPYGRPNIGGDDLSRSANMAYNYALLWYITDNKGYASKAIAILDAWSPVLWDFDYNDAKLLAAWTGHTPCNAAELLRHTNSGWTQKGIAGFTKMLNTVYYPLLRYYYPQANGNWDGAIIHSILAIAIFTDNRQMFGNAVDHFLHAPVNGSLFKYIFPSGQCQETTRDQGHVQLGLGEFAGAAQIAYTQGVDFYSLGGYRLALGYEYTSQLLVGPKPSSYGVISERAKAFRDDYESVYRYYTAMGITMPYTAIAADSARKKASRSVLTAVRAGVKKVDNTALKPSSFLYIGARKDDKDDDQKPANSLVVEPGASLQAAINAAAANGKWVIVKKGIHKFTEPLKMRSGVTLSGEGSETILFLDPASGNREAIVNAEEDMHDVAIRNLVIEGGIRTDTPSDPNSVRSYRGGYNRAGIIFRAKREGQMKNIRLEYLTVQNCTFNGVQISGASGVAINACDFNENGGSVVPGPKLQHNLLLSHSSSIKISASRFATSPFGAGIALDHCEGILLSDSEIARNAFHGILILESSNVSITKNLIEANDGAGVMIDFLHKGNTAVTVDKNRVWFNSGFGIEAIGKLPFHATANHMIGNGKTNVQWKHTAENVIPID